MSNSHIVICVVQFIVKVCHSLYCKIVEIAKTAVCVDQTNFHYYHVVLMYRI